MNNHYNKSLKDLSRRLRNQGVSKAERKLWKELLSRKQAGVGFKRQRAVSRYIVDFFCAELNLIIEIDGSSHFSKGNTDRVRENTLKDLGYRVLRLKEGEVLNNFDQAKGTVMNAITILSSPCTPSKGGSSFEII